MRAALALTVCGCLAASASAAEVVFDRSVHRGDCPVDYVVTVNDTDNPGYFRFTVEVDNTENFNIADITAIYLEFADTFDAADVWDDAPGVDFIAVNDAIIRHIEFNTDNVGNGNISGNGDLFDLFDVGFAVGASDGIPHGDDYQTVVFDVRIPDGVTLDDLEAVAVRGQSVGEPGSARTCSSKEFVLAPCPADFNEDGFTDMRDVLAFLNLWQTGAPAADFNNDGVVDSRDILDFLNAVADGC